jgi:hypothetical protein
MLVIRRASDNRRRVIGRMGIFSLVGLTVFFDYKSGQVQ